LQIFTQRKFEDQRPAASKGYLVSPTKDSFRRSRPSALDILMNLSSLHTKTAFSPNLPANITAQNIQN
jgi:hypothetical protein